MTVKCPWCPQAVEDHEAGWSDLAWHLLRRHAPEAGLNWRGAIGSGRAIIHCWCGQEFLVDDDARFNYFAAHLKKEGLEQHLLEARLYLEGT